MSQPSGSSDGGIPFLPARAKLWLGSLDNTKLGVQAQYNPKELQIDKEVPWEDHKSRDTRSAEKKNKNKDKSKQADLEFNASAMRTMTLELLFDGYEENKPVAESVAILERLSTAEDPEGTEPKTRRPHHCVVAWGDTQQGMKPFRCVITGLSVKYTMWSSRGVALRATCTVKLKEATKMGEKPPEAKDYIEKSKNAFWQEELGRREAEKKEQIQRAAASKAGTPASAAAPKAATMSSSAPAAAPASASPATREEYQQQKYAGLTPEQQEQKRVESGRAASEKLGRGETLTREERADFMDDEPRNRPIGPQPETQKDRDQRKYAGLTPEQEKEERNKRFDAAWKKKEEHGMSSLTKDELEDIL